MCCIRLSLTTACLATFLLFLACEGESKKTANACTGDSQCGGGVCFDQTCYTVCDEQDECAEGEFCAQSVDAGGRQAAICIVASSHEGCASDDDCSDLVGSPCRVPGCDLDDGLCGFVGLAEDTPCETVDQRPGRCQSEVCVPDCEPGCADRKCGDDGCGGSCGECLPDETCVEGSCEAPSSCGDEACDDGENCASCPADCGCGCGEECTDDACVFTACHGLACGDDGCGGSCGLCQVGERCDEGACVPDITCGDEACDEGEDCSSCPADCGCGCGEDCVGGKCKFTACDELLCGDDGCGGSCGACGGGEICDAGACVPDGLPVCGDEICDDTEDCASCHEDCGCGCGEACEDAACAFTACDGRDCGDDGCGGSCGDCPPNNVCDNGKCAWLEGCDNGACEPGEHCGNCPADCGCGCGEVCYEDTCKFAACDGLECGDDGCGGSCGSCDPDDVCANACDDWGRCRPALLEEELCDGLDEDCDGRTDEPFTDMDGLYTLVAHCGGCDVDCAALAPDHMGASCDSTGEAPVCVYACLDDFVDYNGLGEDGCECAFEGDLDMVDDLGVDGNCDGVDGVDADGDFYASEASGGDDCDDTDADVHVGTYDPVGDGVDQNCDGSDGLDVDGDGSLEDGDGSGDPLDNPCVGGETLGCDDNCPETDNPGQADQDGDGVGDACDLDRDGDGVPEDGDLSGDPADAPCAAGMTEDCDDNCPLVANQDQQNVDGDSAGAACDDDDDGDEILDEGDNCPLVANSEQTDTDLDEQGDACDDDDDGDTILDELDNCPLSVNTDQVDTDSDDQGDACDADDDGDTVLDEDDNCPLVANPNQEDADGDGVGNACADDDDNDGVPDQDDNCPQTANSEQVDVDGDGDGNACDADDDDDTIPDSTDNCPLIVNADQTDTDGDEDGDACDDDDDNDGVADDDDNCPFIANSGQADNDSDEDGDVCDPDDDDDGILDDGDGSGADDDALCFGGRSMGCDDNCPFTANGDQADNDGDAQGDLCDPDDDDDTVLDEDDNCPFAANLDQADNELDGLGDVCDPDDDDDGILDDGDDSGAIGDEPCVGGVTTLCDDNCPLITNADQADPDGDALGSACDPDMDGDGFLDTSHGGVDCDDEAYDVNPDSVDLVDAFVSAVDGEFQSRTVEPGVLVGVGPDFVVKDSGVYHLLHHVPALQALHYATDQSGAWITEALPVTDAASETGTLALDASGVVHVAYFDRADASVVYLNNQGGAWAQRMAYALPEEVFYTDITVADGVVTIVFAAADASGAAYEVRSLIGADASFDHEVIEAGLTAKPYLRAEVDDNDQVQVVYHLSGDGLRHAARYGDTWSFPTPQPAQALEVGFDLEAFLDSEMMLSGRNPADQRLSMVMRGWSYGTGYTWDANEMTEAAIGPNTSIHVAWDTDNRTLEWLVIGYYQTASEELIHHWWGSGDNASVVASVDEGVQMGVEFDEVRGIFLVAYSDGDAYGLRLGSLPLTGTSVDMNCDGVDGEDSDGDGYASDDSGGDDCDDAAATTHPGADDPIDDEDQNCDGTDGLDPDGDGVAADGDGSGVDGDAPCGDGVTEDCDDNCPEIANDWQDDMDGDGLGDPCDDDRDGDALANDIDNCPDVSNAGQEDLNSDGEGDACDDDDDGDGEDDMYDNCPTVANPDQENLDWDAYGDLCDDDKDGDDHLPIALSGDDCDDLAPNTYPGAPDLVDDSCTATQEAWEIDDIIRDSKFAYGSSAAAVTYGDGFFHVVHIDRGYDRLFHSQKQHGPWAMEMIDASGLIGDGAPELAVSDAGELHLVYEKKSADKLYQTIMYRSFDGASWSAEEQLAGYADHADPKVGVSSDGTVSVAWYDWESGDVILVFERLAGGDWTFVHDAAGSNGLFDLLVEPDGTRHLAYASASGRTEHHVTDEGGSWGTPKSILTLGSGEITGFDLTWVDSNDIRLASTMNSMVRMASYAGSNWSTELVKALGVGAEDIPMSPSIAVSASGRVHIAWTIPGDTAGTQDLYYSRRDGSIWRHQVLANGWQLSDHVALVLPADDHPWVFHQDGDPDAVGLRQARIIDECTAWHPDDGDANCDGIDGEDEDQDGYASEASGGDDCVDTNMAFHPGASDPDGDGLDQNCDGMDGQHPDPDDDDVLSDGDGSGTAGDALCTGGVFRGCDDNCPHDANADQADLDADEIGDVCDPDADADGFTGVEDGGDDCDDLDATVYPGAADPVAGTCASWIDSWTSEVVDDTGYVGYNPVLDHDALGHAHALYRDDDTSSLRYATDASGAWVTTALPSGTQVNYDSSSMGLDEAGAAHVSFFEAGTMKIHYMNNASGAWVAEDVATLPWGGAYTAIVVAGGVVHLAYSDATSGKTNALRVASYDAGAWSTRDVELDIDGAPALRMAVDDVGAPNLVYLSSGQLKHARYSGTSWDFVAASAAADVNAGFGLHAHGDAQVLISHMRQDDGNIYLTSSSGGASLDSVQLTTSGDVGEYCSVTLVGTDEIHATWYDYSAYSLRHTWYDTVLTSWQTETIDDTDDVGHESWIDVTSADRLRVVYVNDTTGGLMSASNPSCDGGVGRPNDSNCDGVDGVDADGDGVASEASGGEDCDDTSSATYPGAEDSVGDSVDQSCDGVDGMDDDGDGFASVGSGGDDCDDELPTTHPGADDTVGDYMDQNCDDVDGVDADADYWASEASGGEDCDDGAIDINPEAEDSSGDGVDQNCDGVDGVNPDEDSDGVPDDGDLSGSAGDAPCADGVTVDCDDNCFDVFNYDQADLDGDGLGDACDPDADGDGHQDVMQGGDDCDDLDDTIHPSAPEGMEGICAAWDTGWGHEVVAAGDEVFGAWLALSLDRYGARHLAAHVVTEGPRDEVRYWRSQGVGWTATTLDAGDDLGDHLSVDVDVDGHAHVAWYGPNRARYATDAWGAWELTSVDFGRDLGPWVDMAVGPDRVVHLAYYDDHADALMGATDALGFWETAAIDDTGMVGRHAHIDVDAQGTVHVASSGEGTLRYGYDSGAGWQLETVALATGYDGEMALTSDHAGSSGAVHIVYVDANTPALRLLTNEGAGWTMETIDDSGAIIRAPAVVRGSDGAVHVSYYDATNARLMHATNESASWVTAPVTGATTPGEASSLVVVEDGVVHVAWQAADTEDLMVSASPHCVVMGDGFDKDCDGVVGVDEDGDGHASLLTGGDDCDDRAVDGEEIYPSAYDMVGDAVDQNCDGVDGVDEDGDGDASTASGGGDCDDYDRTVHSGAPDFKSSECTHMSGEWPVDQIAASHESPEDVDFFYDSNGASHVVYTSEGELQYMTNRSGDWTALAPMPGYAPAYCALTADWASKAHIACQETSSQYMVYLSDKTGSFQMEWVGTGGVSGRGADIVVDEGYRPHISYHNETAAVVETASYNGSSWQVNSFSAFANPSVNTAITLDMSDKPAVAFMYSYYGEESLSLASGTYMDIAHVDEDVTLGPDLAMVHVGSGTFAVAYQHHGTGDPALRVATGSDAVWDITDLTSGAEVGASLHLLADKGGLLHLGFRGAYGLGYATNATSAWVVSAAEVDHTLGDSVHIGQRADDTLLMLFKTLPSVTEPFGQATHERRCLQYGSSDDTDCDGGDG